MASDISMPCPIGLGATNRMKNLFLKLFLWIWMAFVIAAVTLLT